MFDTGTEQQIVGCKDPKNEMKVNKTLLHIFIWAIVGGSDDFGWGLVLNIIDLFL